MNKKVEKINNTLNARENRNREAVEKAQSEISMVREKLTALTDAMNKADNADQYKALLHEKQDLEETLSFLETRLSDANQNLSTEEYKKMTGDLQKAFAEIQADQRPVIRSEIEKLFKILADYDKDVTDLNNAMTRIMSISGNNSASSMFNARTISGSDQIMSNFMDLYYRNKAFNIASGNA